MLRLAEPLNPADAAAQDPLLAELMTWASTVVRLPLLSSATWLPDALAEFPKEFLLFTPHVTELELRAPEQKGRCFAAERRDDRVTIEHDAGRDEWDVFSVPRFLRPRPCRMLVRLPGDRA